MRCFLIFSALFFILASGASFGSQPLKTPVQQVFSFEPYPDSYSRISNELLQRISQGSGRLRAYTYFNLDASVNSSVKTNPEGKPEGVVNITDVSFSGDVIYRDFSIEKILMPNRVDMTLEVLDVSGKNIYDTLVKAAQVPVNGGDMVRVTLPQRVQSRAVSVKPSSIKFYYTEEAFERFTGWFNAVEQYYAAGSTLEKVSNIIRRLDYYRVESLLLDEFSLCEAEGLFYSVKHAPFHYWIELERSDPENILASINRFQPLLNELRQGYNNAVASIDSLYYELGKLAREEGRPDRSRDHFSRAITYNPFHVPSHLEIALNDLEKNNKSAAISRLGNVIEKMYPHGEQRQNTMAVTKKVLDAAFDQARELTWAHRYLDALAALAPVEDFCRQVSGFYDCPFELQYRITASHMGMYRSFLTVAARARQGNNLAYAETYIASAFEYHINNSYYIPDASEAIEQMQMVHDRYIHNGYLSMGLEDFAKARDQFVKATSLCDKYTGIICPGNAEQYLAQAARLVTIPDETTREAPAAQTHVMIPVNVDIEVIREEILEKLSHGHLRAWAMDVSEAGNSLAEASAMSRQFNLMGDSLISSRILSLSQRIIEKECELTQREFNRSLAESFRFRDRGSVSPAAASAKKAFLIRDSNPGCSLRGTDSLALLQQLVYVADYLDMMDEARMAYKGSKDNNFYEFLEKYFLAETFFFSQGMAQLGLNHTLFPVFVEQTGDMLLANAAIVYMAGLPQQNPEQIKDLLEKLRRNGVNTSEVRQAQEAFGEMLAVQFPDNGRQQVAQLVRSGGRWYQHLEDSFRRHRTGNP